MTARLRRFLIDETGSVTVDWVVLTAAIAALGLGVLTAVGTSMNGVTTEMNSDMATSSDISDLGGGETD